MMYLYLSQHYPENLPWPGLYKKGGEDQVFGPSSRRLARSCTNQDAGSRTLSSAIRRRRGGSREAESGLHTLRILTRGISASMLEDDRGGESRISSPHGKKRTAPEDLETEVSKRGKKPSPRGPASEGILTTQRPQGGQPSAEL